MADRERAGRIRRREGLKAPRRQPERGRLWLDDGFRVQLRPERPGQVRAHGFVEDRAREGRRFRTLRVAGESTRGRLAVRVTRKLGAADATDVLCDLFILRGVPAHVRSDRGPGFVAEAAKGRTAGVGAATTALTERASPRENGCVESSNGKLRDEPPRAEAFSTPREAQALIERWRRHYNTARPHSAPGHRPPRRRPCRCFPCRSLGPVRQGRRSHLQPCSTRVDSL